MMVNSIDRTVSPGRLRAGGWAKERLARLVRIGAMRRLMVAAIRLVVPRHRVGVAVVVLNQEANVLMLRHVFHPGAPWGLPGGWLGRAESPAEGALRELREETGLEATLGPIVHVTHDVAPAHIGLAYVAWARPLPFRLSPEIIEARWCPPQRMPGPVYAFVREAIDAAVAYHRALVAGAAGGLAPTGAPDQGENWNG